MTADIPRQPGACSHRSRCRDRCRCRSRCRPQRREWILSLAGLALSGGLLASSGCQSITEYFNRVQPNNPVVGPAPPRLSLEDSAQDTRGYASLTANAPVSSDILPVSRTEMGDLPVLPDSMPIAVVNGNTILAGDVFAPYARHLVRLQKELPPEQFAQAQRELLKRDLPSHIQRTLLSHALKSTLKQEQINKLDEVLDQAFADHVKTLLEKTGTSSSLELDKKLREEGTSLADIRQTFGVQQLAMQYLATESQVNVQLGRVDLLKHYQDNIHKYTFPTRVKWQEIRISISPGQDRRAAIQKLNEVVKALQAGDEFSEVARKFSDGPTASQGGHWDWTKEDSLSDTKLNDELFTLETGAISHIIESPQHFRIIRIVNREEAHVTPFEDLQMELRQDIIAKKRQQRTAEVLEKLKKTATIKTIFDEDPELAKLMRAIEKL